METLLNYLKQNSDCLYIYDVSPYIYGIKSNIKKYIVVLKRGKNLNIQDFKIDPEERFCFYSIDEWFDFAQNGALIC